MDKIFHLSAASAARRPAIRRVEAVVNPCSGSVGPGAAVALEALLAEHGVAARIQEAEPEQLEISVRAAVAAAPDLLVILAGDGTIAAAARAAGPDGPLLAPLPGGTMNMLPHAIYGPVDWRTALTLALTSGVARPISGGEVDGRAFYVAAILGAPALWADAREALRQWRVKLALRRARRALGRAFSGAVNFDLGAGVQGEAEALALLCPLVSRRHHDDPALEAAALCTKSAGEAVRLGFNALTGDWRDDPAVDIHLITRGWAAVRGHMPAVLDGEPMRLHSEVAIRFLPKAFRVLAPAPAISAPLCRPTVDADHSA